MSTIALRGTATTGSTTVTAPTGVATNDLLIVIAIAPSATTISVPSGWTTVRNVTASNTSTLRMVVAYMLWSSGSSWTFTGATFNVCSAYSGCDTGTPILVENYASGGAVTTLATPTVSNTNAGAWRVCGWGAAETGFNSMNAWATFSPADTRRAESHSSTYGVALTDSAATIATGSTSVTGTTPATYPTYEAELAWIGIIQPVLSTPVNSTDTGSGADSANVAPNASDTAAGTEASTITATTPATDTGTGTESAGIADRGSDTGTGTESANVTAATAETGSALDTASITQGSSDTAAGADSAIAAVLLPVTTDSGSAADGGSVKASTADAASAAETTAITATTPAADTAAGNDNAIAAIDTPAADTASGSDTALVRVVIATTDSATAVEAAAVRVSATESASTIENMHSRHAGQGVPARLRLIKVLPRLPVWTGPA